MTPARSRSLAEGMGRTLAVAGGIAMTLMMLHIVVDVFMKHTFNDPIDGTTEIVAAYYMVATVFLPLAYVTLRDGHLVVELFTARMTGRPLERLTAFTGAITFVYLVFVIWCTTEEAILRTRDGEAWETSVELVAIWPSRWLLPLGLAAMAAIVAIQVVRRIRGADGGPKAPPGV